MIREVVFDFDLKKALSLFDLERFSGGDACVKQLMVKEYNEVEGKLGAMKIETGCNEIVEYVGLSSKMYSLKIMGHIDHLGDDSVDGILIDYMKGKGAPKRALQAFATHEMYKKMIFDPEPSRITFRTLRSKKHTIEHLQIERKLLTSYNEKVFAVTPTFSRPLGHFRNRPPLLQIQEIEEIEDAPEL
mgnify:FL=1